MVTIIAAIDENNGIGKNNQLIWHLPTDLKRFKQITQNNTVIMGRKTFESMGKALPNRVNIVISRNKNLVLENCLVVSSIDEAINVADVTKKIYIIGGAEIYKQSMNVATHLDITKVHHSFDADVFFPEINLTKWEETSNQFNKADEKNLFDFSFISYKKKPLT